MTGRLFLKTVWHVEPRGSEYWTIETTKATGDAATGSIEFGPFTDMVKARDYCRIRQEGIGEMMARMRAQMKVAMKAERAEKAA